MGGHNKSVTLFCQYLGLNRSRFLPAQLRDGVGKLLTVAGVHVRFVDGYDL